MLLVPLPIPPLWYETLPDETGFTMPEKIALRNAWSLVGPDQEYYAHALFIDFFSAHEELLNKFRRSNGEIIMRALHAHPYNMFKNLEAMIFEGLDGLNEMHAIVAPPALKHFLIGIKPENIQLMVDTLGNYLKEVLWRNLSPTLENAINKICNSIVLTHSKP